MCLAAGLATIEGSTDFSPPPVRPMKVENLSIQAPLVLLESKTCQVQTIVDLNTFKDNELDWNDLSIKIFHKLESETTKWLSHAQATFSPLPSTEEKSVPFDVDSFLETISQPCNDNALLTEVYDKLASVGLKFGPTFRSIESCWRKEDSSTLIAKVKVPSVEENSHSHYIFHPVVLDAMIQSVMMSRHTANIKRKLYVPIKIGKFVWLSGTDSSELYIHAFSSPSSEEDNSNLIDSAILVDSTGKPLAIISSVEFIDTTLKAIEAVVEQQNTLLPDMWEQVWKTTPNSAEKRFDPEPAAGVFYDEEFDQKIETLYNTPEPHITDTFEKLKEMCYLYFLRALYDSGWSPVPQQVFCENELFLEMKFQTSFRKYFGFILSILEEEGILQNVSSGCVDDGETKWKIAKKPASQESILNTLNSPAFKKDLVSQFHPTLLTAKFGENLSQIMRGTVSALGILFPEKENGWPSVGDFYNDYATLFRIAELTSSICTQRFAHVAAIVKKQAFYADQKPLVRILEVGAGTGAMTGDFLKSLEELEIEFEYTYTDISAAFFPDAQKKFEKYLNRMVFKKLNIEDDPINQGFTPEYFDYVNMAEVIHATKDIQESLRNIRALMRPYANMDMLEQTRENRLVTYLFGSLEGFWRFQDFELRPKHCTLSKESWRKVYEQCGFQVNGVLSALNDYHSYFCVHKTAEKVENPSPRNQKIWLLFQPSTESSVLSYMRNKIEMVEGRNVVIVTEGTTGLVEKGNGFELRQDKGEDFKALFDLYKERQLDIEGVLYSWALDEQKLSQDEILQPYFHLVKTVLTLKKPPKIIALTAFTTPVEDNDLFHFHSSTIWAFTKSLRNEHAEVSCRCIEIPPNPDAVGLQALFYEIWNCDKETQVAYHGASRYVPRFTSHKPVNNALKLPKGTDKFQLILPETKAIADLQFGPLELGELKEEDVEIQIKASALNFRDVLSVIKPTEEFKNVNAVGFDFAGMIKKVGSKVTKWKVGDRVFGCNTHLTALPSHVQLKYDQLIDLPANMTYCEAATITVGYMTSVTCLLSVAKIKKEDTVLLHTASGGVGLSAIELCKYIGCTIIATAGSKRKQNYLRSIGIQHIFHSRNTQYGDQILELTNGRGVDVVLNSLTSEGFKEATLKACAKGARFVEMSKLNIWKPEELKELRPDVDYTIVDISSSGEDEWIRLMEWLKELQKHDVVQPIPNVRFDAMNIREALGYMQKAKYVGKIVCTMPEQRNEGGELKTHTPMFNDMSTYLITGGLGGIGFVVCQWMLEMGAKYVLLAGRNVPSHSVQSKISELNAKGANVIPIQLDVGSFEQCEKLIKSEIEKMGLPPLRGIMHAAGTLSDGLIFNQEWPKLCSTFNTKVKGTLNLHELTKDLSLEHFVTFSSSAALFGTPAQCNHASGNMFEDNFIHYRNSMGLPGTSVNWGQWGEVGVATEIDIPGINPISNLQGVKALEYALKSQRPQTAVINIKSFVILAKLLPYLSTYLDERIWTKGSGNFSITMKSDEFWEQYDSKADVAEKTDFIKEQLRNILRATLKLDESDKVDDNANFQEIGVDSLMFVDIKNCLQSLLGDRLTVNASIMKDCSNINELSDSLLQQIEGLHVESMEKPTIEEVNDLIREDSVLPEHIRAKGDQEVVAVKVIKRILLTGCTGTLGSYILKGLVANPQISEVICLLRENPAKQEKPLERLRKILKVKELLSDVNLEKVQYVVGNLALPHLGLEPDVWAELSESVDAIVHCAAHVDHTEYYVKISSKQMLRAANIGGTVNILEFACEGRLKHVYFASTLLAVATVDEEERMSEDWPKDGEYDGVTSYAYPISKFVGDVLAGKAIERGIPSKVFRFPHLGGNSKTGSYSIENNHLMLRYLFILKNGAMQSNPAPVLILPVDMCADVSLQLFFNEKAPTGVYNITPLQPSIDQEFVSVAEKFNRQVDLVELSQFLEQVKAAEEHGQTLSLAMFAGVYQDDEEILTHYASAAILKKWVEGNDEIWRSKKVSQLLPNFYAEQRPTMEYVNNDLLFAKRQGWFTKFGL